MQYLQPTVCYIICVIVVWTELLNGQDSAKAVRTKSNKGIHTNTNYQSHSPLKVEEVEKLRVTQDTNEEDIFNYQKQQKFQNTVTELYTVPEDRNVLYGTYPSDSQYELSDSNVVDNNSDINNSTKNDTKSANCTRCFIRKEDKLMRIEMIKQDILSKLRFTTLPNMTGKKIPKIPPIAQVMESFGMQSDQPYGEYPYDEYHNEDEFYGQTERLYTIAQEPPPELAQNISNVCYFDLPNYAPDRRVQKALLWVYIRPVKHIQNTITEIFIYKIASPGKHGTKTFKSLVRHRKVHAHKTSGWHNFDVENIVHSWIRHPENNIGLVIEAFDHLGNNIIVTPPGEGKDEGYEPMLDMKTVELKRSRIRRSLALQCEENSTEVRCCRYPLVVDFVEFGWDWVIAPTTYKANYCSGQCRYSHMDSNPHTTVVQQVSRYNSNPCCTPTTVLPLSMLYFDSDHHIFYSTMPAMTVTKCGCA
ncbi:hypothetical protein ScPMuIL_015413 [Solemya velum]